MVKKIEYGETSVAEASIKEAHKTSLEHIIDYICSAADLEFLGRVIRLHGWCNIS